jgi:uncharacterized membrane protein
LFLSVVVLRDFLLFLWDIEIGSSLFSLYLLLVVVVFPIVTPIFRYCSAQYIGNKMQSKRVMTKLLFWSLLLVLLMPFNLASCLFLESYVHSLKLWLFYFPLNFFLVIVWIIGFVLIIYGKVKVKKNLINNGEVGRI